MKVMNDPEGFEKVIRDLKEVIDSGIFDRDKVKVASEKLAGFLRSDSVESSNKKKISSFFRDLLDDDSNVPAKIQELVALQYFPLASSKYNLPDVRNLVFNYAKADSDSAPKHLIIVALKVMEALARIREDSEAVNVILRQSSPIACYDSPDEDIQIEAVNLLGKLADHGNRKATSQLRSLLREVSSDEITSPKLGLAILKIAAH
jgi:hypothetical protein